MASGNLLSGNISLKLFMTPSNTMQLKVIDDDIYYRIIEFKAKNEIIRMNRNYSNVKKRIWTDKYVHEHHAHDKNNAGYVDVGSFP